MAGKKNTKEELIKELKLLKSNAGKIAQEVSQPLQVISMILSQIEHGVVKTENIKRGLRMIERIVELADELKSITAKGGEVSVDEISIKKIEQEDICKPGKANKILVVDDNVDIVDMMIENFRLIGYRCDGAADGKSAIPLVEKNSYDLIISDLLMPKMSGKQLFEAVKKMDYKGKFLFLTGYVVSDELKKIVKRADGILYKPFQLEELFDLAEKLLKDE